VIPNIPWKPALALLAIVGLCLLLLAYCDARKDAKEARSKATVAQSQAKLGEDALDRSDALNEAARANEAQTQANTDFVNEADNAKTDAGDAGLRGRLLYCERERMRGKPQPEWCNQLRIAYPAFRP